MRNPRSVGAGLKPAPTEMLHERNKWDGYDFRELARGKRFRWAVPAFLLILLTLPILLSTMGCGLRQPQTGSLHGRLLDASGNVVPNAQIYSIFAEEEKVFSGNDGVFYLSELPAGRNRIVITHPNFRQEEREVTIINSEVTRLETIRLTQGAAPKFISESRVDRVTSGTAVIAWKTYKPLVCSVEYGTSLNYGSSVSEREPAEDHQLTLTGLTPETIYHSRIRFVDESSLTWFSYDLPFQTSAGDGPAAPNAVRIKDLPAYGVVRIEWDLSTSTSTVGYRVRRRDNSGDWTIQTTDLLDRNAREYSDQTAHGGHVYEYAATALNGQAGESVFSTSPRVFMPGFINEELRMTASNSPYLLVSDLIVGVGVNLYVEPGVEMRVAASDVFRLGQDPDRVEILLQGRALMLGTKESPIRFTPMDGVGSRDHWAGISIQSGESGDSELSWVELFGAHEFAILVDGVQATIENISVRYSQGGLKFSDARNAPAIDNCIFTDIASTAISVHNCRRFQITACTVINAGLGIRFVAGNSGDLVSVRETYVEAIHAAISGVFSNSTIANSTFVCPSGTGVEYVAANGQKNALDHCTIDASLGVIIASGVPTIENNIINCREENGTYGFLYTAPNAPSFHYNNVFGFSTAYQGCNAGLGATSFKPEFVGGNPFDFHLVTASALKHSDKYGFESGRYGKSYY